VLTTLAKVLAPVIPFVTERMYGNLRQDSDPESVHLCDYPVEDAGLIDERLSYQMRVAQHVASAARALREQAGQRVRQPLAELRVGAASGDEREALEALSALVTDELNVKKLVVQPSLGDLTSVTVKPNFRTLGAKYGKEVQQVAALVRVAPAEVAQQLAAGTPVELGGHEVTPEDVAVQTVTAEGWAVGSAGPIHIALDTRLTDELRKEGLARDVVRHIQQLRKDSGLDISDRIEVAYETDSNELRDAIASWREYIMGEVQANRLEVGNSSHAGQKVRVGASDLTVAIRRKAASRPT
jgi:isoleucyl-tRNA synthetase